MLSLYDAPALRNALTLPLRADIKALLHERIAQIFADGLEDLSHIVVLCPGDTETALKTEVLFSPLEREGKRWGDSGFQTWWDWLHDHGGWFEIVYCTGDSGFAFVLFVEDADGDGLADLLAMCRAAGRDEVRF
ncbi:hypothetical protein [Sphingobium sp. WCS2017Hpa-17]|uniref:hypothetical protein n=1 Tax=Sphingobium sp. WCS2017Hpa-17 TaxID=3073638 RepID=UPI00288BA7B0|nr:hypothetical protein [Sphingobium sp. WCS2017Hpa-17]